MEDIRHRVGINPPITEVCHAFASREGAANPWPDDEQISSRG